MHPRKTTRAGCCVAGGCTCMYAGCPIKDAERRDSVYASDLSVVVKSELKLSVVAESSSILSAGFPGLGSIRVCR